MVSPTPRRAHLVLVLNSILSSVCSTVCPPFTHRTSQLRLSFDNNEQGLRCMSVCRLLCSTRFQLSCGFPMSVMLCLFSLEGSRQARLPRSLFAVPLAVMRTSFVFTSNGDASVWNLVVSYFSHCCFMSLTFYFGSFKNIEKSKIIMQLHRYGSPE